ncbi:MAG: DUF302 domain-containing protein [Acidobacteria bacterium]|nr:DUF302 domain-containing protein [Acidobacteriota bacterium]MBI3656441.1 DUF302 domain-containing protein [Acidobacteriota bacterium]
MSEMIYTVETKKSFDEAVAAVEKKTAEKSFRVLHTHDVTATLAEKGFAREPLKIVEICNARYASEVLQKDVRTAVMLPCPISVYRVGERTFISTMRPTAMAPMFPGADLEALASEVEGKIIEIVNEAKG